MKRLLAVLLAALAPAVPATTPAATAAPSDYAGDWAGTLGGTDPGLPLVLHVDPDADVAVTLDSPSQGAFGLPAAEPFAQALRGGALAASWPELGASFAGRLTGDGERIDGRFVQGGREFALELTRADGADLAPPPQPQDPVRPLPYREETVSVEVPGTDVTLAGTLTLPDGEGPFPGAVLISGSGPQDRDETLLGHRPFLVLSDRLTRVGVAVLRHDDRGIGASTGTFAGATSEDFAADAAAALAHLKARPDVDRAGFVGHSEGGLVAPLAIARHDAAADFVVSLAGPFVPMRDVLARAAEDRMRLAGQDEGDRATNVAVQHRILDAALVDGDEEAVCAAIDRATLGLPESVRSESRRLCGPWFRTILRLDPAALHRAADVPTLALFGALDAQVAAGPNAAAARALPTVEARTIPGANHLFQGAGTGAASEYAAIEETMREEVMDLVADWVAAFE